MAGPTNSFWTFIAERARRYVSWTLRKAGIPEPRRSFLEEDALQDALLELLEDPASSPAGEPPERKIKQAVWRTTARVLRRDRKKALGLEGSFPAKIRSPEEEVHWKEFLSRFSRELAGEERELFRRIVEGDVPFKPSGAIHRSALAEELGISRRSLGRRLDRLAGKFEPPRGERKSRGGPARLGKEVSPGPEEKS